MKDTVKKSLPCLFCLIFSRNNNDDIFYYLISGCTFSCKSVFIDTNTLATKYRKITLKIRKYQKYLKCFTKC